MRLDASDVPGVPLGAGRADDEGRERRLGARRSALSPRAPTATPSTWTACRRSTRATRPPASPTTTRGAWSTSPARMLFDTKNGAARRVAEVTTTRRRSACSAACTSTRRPATRRAGSKYPVLYLLHGAGDSDDSWTHRRPRRLHPRQPDRRRKAAKPMIVVMPAGHTRRAAGAERRSPGANAAFAGDFVGSVVPYIEQHYRVATERDNTAIAGLSMGGGQTLDIAMAHPEGSATSACSAPGSSASSRVGGAAAPPRRMVEGVERLGEAQRRGAGRREGEEGAEAVLVLARARTTSCCRPRARP